MEKHYDLSTIRYFANKVKILKLCEKLAQRETRWGIISWRMTKVSRRTVIHLLEEEIQERKFSKKTLSKKIRSQNFAPRNSVREQKLVWEKITQEINHIFSRENLTRPARSLLTFYYHVHKKYNRICSIIVLNFYEHFSRINIFCEKLA